MSDEETFEGMDIPDDSSTVRSARKKPRKSADATTYAPKKNAAFMDEIKTYRDMTELTWGDMPYSDVLESILRSPDRCSDAWVECKLAVQCKTQLRLVPADWSPPGRPIVSLPKLLRYAVLLGSPYLELDLVSSHPRQILKYARKHELRRDGLEWAFGSRSAITSFRACLAVDMQLPVAAVKAATNMVCYGSSLKDWIK